MPDLRGIETHLKVATFGDGLILRLRNITADAVRIPLETLSSRGRLTAVDVLEQRSSEGDLDAAIELVLPAFAERSIRITIA
jgi:hypothetical protein